MHALWNEIGYMQENFDKFTHITRKKTFILKKGQLKWCLILLPKTHTHFNWAQKCAHLCLQKWNMKEKYLPCTVIVNVHSAVLLVTSVASYTIWVAPIWKESPGVWDDVGTNMPVSSVKVGGVQVAIVESLPGSENSVWSTGQLVTKGISSSARIKRNKWINKLLCELFFS